MQAGLERKSSEKSSIALADCEPAGNGLLGRRGHDGTVEEGVYVVVDVVMQPGKDSARFVGGRGKRSAKLVSQPAYI